MAQEPWLFLVGRLRRGRGRRAVLACGLAVLAHEHPPGPARLHATSVWGASVGLGITAGAVLAAALEVGSGWREAYVVTGVAALVLLVPSRTRIRESSASTARRVDRVGLVLLATTATTIVSALTQGRDGIDGTTVALVVVTVAASVALVVVEGRAADPLVDPGLLAAPGFRVATLGSFTLGWASSGCRPTCRPSSRRDSARTCGPERCSSPGGRGRAS